MKLPRFLKRVLTAGLALTMAVSIAGCGDGGGGKGENHLNIATGGTAGAYFPIGTAISKVVNQNVEGIKTSVQSTGASVANINMLAENQVQMAIVQNDIAYYAVNGENMFDKKIDTLRGVASLYPETLQFVTLIGSGIRTLDDLEGKRVAVGVKGSGVEVNVQQVLKAYNLTYDNIDEQFLSFAEAANALKEGTIDVACVTAGYPTPAIQEVAEEKSIRIIPLDEDKISALTKDYPFYTKTIIPADVYKGISQETPTVSVMAILVTTDKVDEKTGYEVTKAIFSNTDKLVEAHPAAKAVDKKSALTGMGFIKMNDGAEKFLKE